MNRQFEKEYTQSNDRIHPRQELLQELEAKWAAEQAQQAEQKVRAFPTWARFVAAAAGILLCIGVGMGSVMLYTRSRGLGKGTAVAEASVETEGAADLAAESLEEETILYEAEADTAPAATEFPAMMLAAPAEEAPQGTHFALDEAEVENAVRFDTLREDAGVPGAENQAEAPLAQAKAAGTAAPTQLPAATEGTAAGEAAETAAYPRGKVIRRDDLYAVFLPTLEQVHIVEYADRKISNLFSLTLREKGTQVENVFWIDGELLALRTRNGETELLRFDVSDWKSPKHLPDMTQSGTLLGAWEMNGRLYILSLYAATEEEPLPWVNGARLDFDRVLLDRERPGDTFALITVYEPGQGDDFSARLALLSPVRGAVETGDDRLLLWAGEEKTELYVLSLGDQGLTLASESTRPGTVLSALGGEGFALLLQNGSDAEFLTLDEELNETGGAAARGVGQVSWGQVYGDGAAVLTADGLHYLTAAGDRSLAVAGDAFVRLTDQRGLLLSADGTLQLVALGAQLEALGSVRTRNGELGPLPEDLSRLAFDPDTNRLAIPAGQNVYPYLIDEEGNITLRGETQVFYDHNEAEQRELRVLFVGEQALIFHKSGIALCNQALSRQLTSRY